MNKQQFSQHNNPEDWVKIRIAQCPVCGKEHHSDELLFSTRPLHIDTNKKISELNKENPDIKVCQECMAHFENEEGAYLVAAEQRDKGFNLKGKVLGVKLTFISTLFNESIADFAKRKGFVFCEETVIDQLKADYEELYGKIEKEL